MSDSMFNNWGHSSAGRALAWHARGRGSESRWLHSAFSDGFDGRIFVGLHGSR